MKGLNTSTPRDSIKVIRKSHLTLNGRDIFLMLLLLSMYCTHTAHFLQMNSQSTIHLYIGGKEIFLQNV